MALPDRTEARLTIKDYPKIIVKRIWILVGVFVIGVGAVTALTFKMTPTYRATATVQIRNPNQGAKVLSTGATLLYGNVDSQKYYQTQYMLLQQPSTIRKMVRSQILDEGEPVEEFKEFAGFTEDQIVQSIVGNIEVTERKRTEIVDISVEGTDPKVLHKVTNALVDTFTNMQTTTLRMMRQTQIHELEVKANDARVKMEREEKELNRFLQQHGKETQFFEVHFEQIQQRQETWQGRLDDVRLELVDLEPTAASIEGAIEKDPEGWVDRLLNHPYVRRDPRLQELDREILQKQAKHAQLLEAGLGSGDREVVTLVQDIRRLRSIGKQEAERLLLSVPDLIAELQAREKSIQAGLEEIETKYREFATLKVTFSDHTRIIERYRDQTTRIHDMLGELVTGEQADDQTVKLVELATQPKEPISPNVALNLGLAALLSLIAGFGLVLLLEYVDDTLMTKEEVDRLGEGIPFLGVIRNIKPSGPTVIRPDVAGLGGAVRVKDLFAVEQPKSTVAEDFRGVRTALSFGEGLDDDRVFLVTSSSPKEGKTTVTINLATVMAYSGLKTLLIDADLRKPRIHKSFGISNEVGLTNVIIGRGTPADCIRHPDIENLDHLDLLTSGPIPPNPSELLGRPHLREILRELMAQYDRILIDSPPLGAVTDAAVLGRVVDRTILVVKAGKTKRRLIENAIEQLRTVNARFAGVVLNDLKSTATRYYPGYYQYYYYSAYGNEDARRKGA